MVELPLSHSRAPHSRFLKSSITAACQSFLSKAASLNEGLFIRRNSVVKDTANLFNLPLLPEVILEVQQDPSWYRNNFGGTLSDSYSYTALTVYDTAGTKTAEETLQNIRLTENFN